MYRIGTDPVGMHPTEGNEEKKSEKRAQSNTESLGLAAGLGESASHASGLSWGWDREQLVGREKKKG